MEGRIFVLQADETLKALSQEPYDSEELLQTLLAKYPELLAGDQMDRTNPPRWLLITREQVVPSTEQGGGRWALDHLFLDQHGIPTLVEVKRSSDTRIRREVVGQMLDYAANGVIYWSLNRIRMSFEATCQKQGRDPDEVLAEFLTEAQQPEPNTEAFWEQVLTNLKARRIRLVFVADVVPAELRRIVEFLNAEMTSTRVFAVEIRQFVGEGVRTLVPTVLGGSAQESRPGERAPARQWDRESFLAEFEPELAAVAERLLGWIEPRVNEIWWGQGSTSGSFVPTMRISGRRNYSLFTCRTKQKDIQIYFGVFAGKGPLVDEEKRMALREQLNQISGVNIPVDGIVRYPSLPLRALETEEGFRQFTTAMQWVIDQVQAAN